MLDRHRAYDSIEAARQKSKVIPANKKPAHLRVFVCIHLAYFSNSLACKYIVGLRFQFGGKRHGVKKPAQPQPLHPSWSSILAEYNFYSISDAVSLLNSICSFPSGNRTKSRHRSLHFA
jgi:hypothetical protein